MVLRILFWLSLWLWISDSLSLITKFAFLSILIIADMMAMKKVYGCTVFGTLDLDGHMNAHILIGPNLVRQLKSIFHRFLHRNIQQHCLNFRPITLPSDHKIFVHHGIFLFVLVLQVQCTGNLILLSFTDIGEECALFIIY